VACEPQIDENRSVCYPSRIGFQIDVLDGKNQGESFIVGVSSDGKTIATVTLDHLTVVLWDGRTGKKKSSFNVHEGLIQEIRFSPNNEFLALRIVPIRFKGAKLNV
jgi:WD40 repeat protein